MRIANKTGQDQELHYFDKTIVLKPNEEHNVDLSNIGYAEMTRVVKVFTEIKEEKKPVAQKQQPQAQQKSEVINNG